MYSKQLKKTLSVVMTLFMILGMMPTGVAFAAAATDISVTASAGTNVGDTNIHAIAGAGGTLKYEISDVTEAAPEGGAAEPGGLTAFTAGDMTIAVDKYIHVYEIDGSTTVVGYGEHQVLASDIKALDKTAIDTAISAANTAKTDVVISADGKDVAPGTNWVTSTVNDALDSAITTATNAKATVTTDLEVTNAAAALNGAVSTYNTAKADGTKALGTDLSSIKATVSNNSLLVGKHIFQLTDTNGFTSANVVTALATAPAQHLFFKSFNGKWYDLTDGSVANIDDLTNNIKAVVEAGTIDNVQILKWFKSADDVTEY